MVSAIIVAAGQGVRMGNTIPKQYLTLGNHPILAYSLMAFSVCSSVDKLYLVVAESDIDYCRHKIVLPLKLGIDIQLVPGGPQRQLSVYNGLREIEDRQGIVVIHDGVRPFVKTRSHSDLYSRSKGNRRMYYCCSRSGYFKKSK